jgi:endonuclease/exonuclease/phosphatase family metal-dependent hydrolase
MIRRVTMRVVSWNLFHGRDYPPDPALFTWRSRLLRTTERNDTHLQVNRELEPEFARVLAAREWDVAILQECPPRFESGLASAAGAHSHRVLTSRNWLLPLTDRLGRLNPDLIASWDGGSNLTLVRGAAIGERREVVLTRRPERRAMALTRLESGLCVANLHASTSENDPEADIRLGADAAIEFAAGAPLVFGGDLNLRPASTTLFDELAERHGLRAPTAPDVIDHLLVRGLEVIAPPARLPPEAREVREADHAIRLSDHAILEATFATCAPGRRYG